jgi:hypothetical protein
MKHTLCYSAVLVGSLLLQGCGGSGLIGGPQDKNDLKPVAEEVKPYKLRPSATAPTITTKDGEILDAAGAPVQLRGINMQFTKAATVSSIAGIKAVKDAGSNTVHLYINENTSDADLEIALSKVVEQGMLAIITLTDGPLIKFIGQDKHQILEAAVKSLWLDKWLGVIAQDRFQPHIMINIADSWGEKGIYNPNNDYSDYMKSYKLMISLFREAGLKVPLIIDAPFGDDYYAFSNDRGQKLLAADDAQNLIVGVRASGKLWDTASKMSNAFSTLKDARLPYVVDSFGGSGVEGDDLDHLTLMQKAVGDSALGLTLPWVSTSDSAAYVIPFAEPMALINGVNFIAKLYLPSSYVAREITATPGGDKLIPTGKLTFAIYVRDVSGNTLQVGSVAAKELNEYQWNSLSFTMPKTLADVKPADYLNGATTIDFTKIKEVGIQLLANGKAVAITGTVKLDDLEIYPGSPPPTLAVESTFNTGNSGWANPEWSPGKVTFADGYAKFTMKAGDWGLVMESPGWQSQEVLPKIDFKQTVFVDMKVFVPASYAGQTPSFTVNGNFGNDWEIKPSTGAGIVGGGELKYGEWNDYRAVLKWSSSFDVSKPQNIDVRMSGVVSTEPILVDTITITQQLGQKMKTVSASQYKATFSDSVEGFVNAGWDYGKATLKIEDGALLVTVAEMNKAPKDSKESKDAINKSNIGAVAEVDTKGNTTIKMKIFIPADWAGKDFSINAFMQNWSGSVAHYQYAQFKVADLEPGAWKSIEIKPNDFPAGYNRGSLSMLGFQFEGTPAGTVKFDDIEIIGDTQVPDSLPLYTMNFDNQAEIDAVKFDFAGGALSESALVSAKGKDWKIAPFGWTASSWIGNTGANAVLDISKAEDLVDLTARGDEIVNFPLFGIKATSLPATFPPAPLKP